MNSLPIIAIVGLPNAGKSTLMNKIAGGTAAVTSPVAGTTRDRQYIDTAWNGVHFTLVDTAGLAFELGDELEKNVAKQIDIALQEADAVLFVVDGKETRASLPQTTLKKFRSIKKPLFLCVNKMDSPTKREERLAEFSSLGIKPMFPVSSISGRGIGDMLDHVVDIVSKLKEREEETEINKQEPIAISLVGKPNVGKSSIMNSLLGEERVVVSAVAGTTRTAIDSPLMFQNEEYVLIDTAGLKKKEYRQEQPDIFSGFQTFKSIRRSDVCFFVIDSTEELTKQDQRVAQEIIALEKGCIILATKKDIYKGSEEKLKDYISMHFPFLWMSPIFFVSGVTGEGLTEAMEAVKPIYEARHKTIDQEVLTEFLKKKMAKNPPKLLRDQKQPKVTGLRQVATNPPAFELAVNHPAAISEQFRKFVQNAIVKELGFWGTPIIFRLKGKDKA